MRISQLLQLPAVELRRSSPPWRRRPPRPRSASAATSSSIDGQTLQVRSRTGEAVRREARRQLHRHRGGQDRHRSHRPRRLRGHRIAAAAGRVAANRSRCWCSRKRGAAAAKVTIPGTCSPEA